MGYFASHSHTDHKMYTSVSLASHRGVEIRSCDLTHKQRNKYQLCVNPSRRVDGTGTFIETSQLQGTLTPALTAGDHWDAHLGLRLTKGTVLYTHINSTGWTVGIAYSELPVETFTGQPSLKKKGCGRASFSPRSLLPYPLNAGLWLPLILKTYYLKK